MRTPTMKSPCKDCPFRKDATRGWLGEARAKDIVSTDTFICHKTREKELKQCAGHMLVMGNNNVVVRAAAAFDIDLELTGAELVFASENDFIKHHKY